jgi:hypothetical protein
VHDIQSDKAHEQPKRARLHAASRDACSTARRIPHAWPRWRVLDGAQLPQRVLDGERLLRRMLAGRRRSPRVLLRCLCTREKQAEMCGRQWVREDKIDMWWDKGERLSGGDVKVVSVRSSSPLNMARRESPTGRRTRTFPCGAVEYLFPIFKHDVDKSDTLLVISTLFMSSFLLVYVPNFGTTGGVYVILHCY